MVMTWFKVWPIPHKTSSRLKTVLDRLQTFFKKKNIFHSFFSHLNILKEYRCSSVLVLKPGVNIYHTRCFFNPTLELQQRRQEMERMQQSLSD